MSYKMNDALSGIFSKRLADVRKTRQLSQKDIGELTGLAPSHISYIESGKRHPMLETVYRLSTALDCSSDYLLGLNDIPERVSISKEAYDELVHENDTLRKIINDAVTGIK